MAVAFTLIADAVIRLDKRAVLHFVFKLLQQIGGHGLFVVPIQQHRRSRYIAQVVSSTALLLSKRSKCHFCQMIAGFVEPSWDGAFQSLQNRGLLGNKVSEDTTLDSTISGSLCGRSNHNGNSWYHKTATL